MQILNLFKKEEPKEIEVKSSVSFFPLTGNYSRGYDYSTTVAACVLWGQRAVLDAELVQETYKNNQWIDLPLPRELTESPDGMSFEDKLQAIYSDSVYGNALLVKLRNGRNKVVGFQYIPWNSVTVHKTENNTKIISYSISGANYLPKDCVHIKFGSNPSDHLTGYNKYDVILSLVNTDNLIELYQESLASAPAPSAILTPKESKNNITQEAIDKISAKFREMSSMKNAGKVMVLSHQYDMIKQNYSPSELDLTNVSNYVEEKICAVLGIPTQVVGLGENRSTFSNMEQANIQAISNNIIPFLQTVAKAITSQVPEIFFESRLRFKTEEMTASQTQLNQESERVTKMYASGLISRGTAQSILGFKPTEEDFTIYAKPTVPILTEGNQ